MQQITLDYTGCSLFLQPPHPKVLDTIAPQPHLFTFNSLQSLLNANDFRALTKQAIDKSNSLRNAINDVDGTKQPAQVLRLLDNISNVVCSVIDAAELCRNTHASEDFRLEAEKAFSALASYIQVLNTDTGLYNKLVALTSPEIFEKLTEEEKLLGLDLKLEFERDGIHLNDNDRKISSKLHNDVISLESQFMQNIVNDNTAFEIGPLSKEQCASLKPWLAQYQPNQITREMYVTCSSNKRIVSRLIRSIDDENVRKQIHLGSIKQPSQNKEILGGLVKSRYLLANKQGFTSFVHKYLSNKVVKTSSEVQKLLNETAAFIRPTAAQEVQVLLELKRNLGVRLASSKPIVNTQEALEDRLYAWDIGYLISKAQSTQHHSPSSLTSLISHKNPLTSISEYLPLSLCIQSLLDISETLFGISFHKQPVTVYDKWDAHGSLSFHDNSDMLKFSATGPSGEDLGSIYLDLFHRKNKFPNAAHFTVRCGTYSDSSVSDYQSPIVVLVFNITPNHGDKVNSLLSYHELEVLYHEWGHAMHSLLSRTTFQHLSGTRGSTDFVEVPSHLFEFFARTPSVVTSWARHYRTHERLPSSLLEDVLMTRRRFASIDMQHQLLYAAVDQYAFGDNLGDLSTKTPLEVFGELSRGVHSLQLELTGNDIISMDLLAHGHFTNYGGGYYSYLFARMYASQIWERRFANDPLNPLEGGNLWQSFLKFGASKDPSLLLADMAKGRLDPSYLLRSL